MGTTRVAFASSHLLGVLRACKPKTRPSLIRELGSWYSIQPRERESVVVSSCCAALLSGFGFGSLLQSPTTPLSLPLPPLPTG